VTPPSATRSQLADDLHRIAVRLGRDFSAVLDEGVEQPFADSDLDHLRRRVVFLRRTRRDRSGN
jgi:hypothetical protein